MKQYAQAILQFTGYPLEPIVAFEIRKSFQSKLMEAFANGIPFSTEALQTEGFIYNTADVDERWFINYE